LDKQLSWVFTLRLRPGQLEAFKTMVSEIVPLAQEEPGTLAYEWSLNHDQTIAHIYERYIDSAAFVSHVNDTFGPFAERFMSMVEVLSLVVYGEPDAKCREALDSFNASYMTLFNGFSR
jgi:autoinducer 2-degrading protein